MSKLIKVRIYGKVQGVSFRASTRRKARELGLTGFVQNEPDGTVYAEMEGEQEQLDAMLKWCHEGPPLARVDRIEVEEDESVDFQDFQIRR